MAIVCTPSLIVDVSFLVEDKVQHFKSQKAEVSPDKTIILHVLELTLNEDP